ncbi:MAG: hypothetical protein BroJett029_34020 [Alphaproteobacteria bacterium]|nr:MAG: hypothetical protein BroJett029_34020 [Alphaproteobacteria bacterium]
MSSRNAQRRGAKASRRKKLLAERRKRNPPDSRPSLERQAQQFASAPLYACLLQDELFERGNGTLILARDAGAGMIAMTIFLLDVFCLGVKDVIFQTCDEEQVEAVIEGLSYEAPLIEVDLPYARKLLRDSVAWARSLGFEPPKEYAAAERLFGDSSAEACDASFSFGHDGRPLYIPGPSDTPAKIRQRIATLSRHLGEDGFDIALVVDDDLDEDDVADDEFPEDLDGPAYDPAEAPDPEEWLALDEDERIAAVLAYHRRARTDAPRVHAIFHIVVENQIAESAEPVCRAVRRLMGEGLDRHDAIHAVGAVLAQYLTDAVAAGSLEAISNDAYFAAVDRLTAESWRRDFGVEAEPEET